MSKFQVDLPEGFDTNRPEFAFRGADPVNVGEAAQSPDVDPRQKSLSLVLSILMQSHDHLQKSDSQLFVLTDFVSRLKTGESSIEGNEGIVTEMVQNVRKGLIGVMVSLEQTLLTIDLEERGVLGSHDGREYARLGLKLLDDTRKEYERWGLSPDDVPGFPPEAEEAMRQACAELEQEETAK